MRIDKPFINYPVIDGKEQIPTTAKEIIKAQKELWEIYRDLNKREYDEKAIPLTEKEKEMRLIVKKEALRLEYML